MGIFNEADHPRDEDGKFTYKNGGSSTGSDVLEGKVVKTDTDSDDVGGNGSVWGKAGDILKIIINTVTNPEVVQAALNIALTVKSAQEQHKLLKRLYENYEHEKKMEDRANILYPTMKNKENGEITGGAAKIVTDEIAGVKKGEPKSLEEAMQGVNPDYSYNGNITHKTNCQADVIIADARVMGFDVETSIDYESEIKDKLSERPNIAYIDPKTGKIPEFTKIKANNEMECEQWLNNNIKQGERHIFAFKWKQKTFNGDDIGHVLIVTKDINDELKVYDPQNNIKYKDANILLQKIKYNYSLGEEKNPPMILRVDDKEFNYNILNQISKPARK
jgi:hypothetical protein